MSSDGLLPRPPLQVLRDISKGLALLQAFSPLAAVQRVHTLSQLLALQQHNQAATLMPGQVRVCQHVWTMSVCELPCVPISD